MLSVTRGIKLISPLNVFFFQTDWITSIVTVLLQCFSSLLTTERVLNWVILKSPVTTYSISKRLNYLTINLDQFSERLGEGLPTQQTANPSESIFTRLLKLLVTLEGLCLLCRSFSLNFNSASKISPNNENLERGFKVKITEAPTSFLPSVVNDFVISFSIVFTRLSAVIAIERDWWRVFFLFNMSKEESRKDIELMAFFSSLPAMAKVTQETINGSGQRRAL